MNAASNTIVDLTEERLEEAARLFDAYRGFYGQAESLATSRQFLTDRFQNGESVVKLALRDGDAVGFTQLYPSFSSVSARRVWVLNDLFVDPNHRRLGVGEALLEAAYEYASQDGAIRLELATANDNAAAQSLYERNGWELESSFRHYYRSVTDAS